jgi:TolB protein
MKTKSILASAVLFACLSNYVHSKQVKDFGVTVHPDNQHIVYYSYRDEELPDIFVLDQKTGAELNLTQSPQLWDIEPAYSPDGKQIAFSSGENMQAMNIYLMNSDGTNLRKVSSDTGGSNTRPHFSPDGQKLVFNSFAQDGSATLYVIDLDKGKQLSLTQKELGNFSGASWSPNGQFIAAIKQDADNSEIVVMNTDGSSIRQISHTPEYNEGFLNWHPDSNIIISSVGSARGFNQLYAYHINGKAKPIKLTENGDNHSYFSSFNADGKELYFEIGSWQSDFFIHKAKWTGKALKGIQVTGLDELKARQDVIDSHHKPLVGNFAGLQRRWPF